MSVPGCATGATGDTPQGRPGLPPTPTEAIACSAIPTTKASSDHTLGLPARQRTQPTSVPADDAGGLMRT